MFRTTTPSSCGVVPVALLLARSLALAFVLIVARARVGDAQTRPTADTGHAGAVRRATRDVPVTTATFRTGPITVDGSLDELAWAAARPITTFTQQQPTEGKPATQRTEVRILYDNDAIYIGARMYDTHGAAGVRTRLVRRDASANSDLLTIDFDPFHDRLHFAEFTINPSGVRGDALDGDYSWDPVWEGTARVDSLGWTAELRIPLSQLRFAHTSEQTWGLEITRIVQRLNETDQWAFWHLNAIGGPSFYGDLTGLRFRGGSSGLEVVPYVLAGMTRLAASTAGNPLYDAHPSTFRAGADVKYPVASNLTLSATINPDFGQVEVDPAVVNLSAFETFFQEKRPFFVEGSSLFQFGEPGCNINCNGGLNLFYSRRIGRAPEGASLAFAAGQYTNVPQNSAIAGAVKLTGRTASGYTVGLLDAASRGAAAPVITSSGARISQAVEPQTNDFTGRVTREMRNGNLVIGGIITSVDRNINDPGLASLLGRHAETGGLDADVSWDAHNYEWYTAVAASNIMGDSAAIRRLQQSSARYFQRPDRKQGSNGLFSDAYDPSATALRGYSAITRVVKHGGDWLWDLNAADVSPGFEPNDLGFLRQVDYRWVNGSLGRQFTRPTALYRSLVVFAETEQQWNYSGDVTKRDLNAFTSATLANYWTVTVDAQRTPSLLSDQLTRGGPVVRRAGNWNGAVTLATDPRRSIILSTSPSYMRTDDGGFDQSLDLALTWRPASNIEISADPQLSASRTTDQYVQTVSDPTATSFYGRRYVLAHLDQRTLAMTTRVNVTFTPSLSLEMFAQPLLASGNYTQFGEFAAPRLLRKLAYGQGLGTITSGGSTPSSIYIVDPDGAGPASSFVIPNPNFNLRSLRGTAVLRWEYLPGSTAYLVWTQTRNNQAPIGTLDFGRDGAALSAAHPDNIFLLKISYWLTR